MTSHRDSFVNIPKHSPTRGAQQRREFDYEMPEFKVFKCDSCHIKVSTSNGKCPCCEKQLDAQE